MPLPRPGKRDLPWPGEGGGNKKWCEIAGFGKRLGVDSSAQWRRLSEIYRRIHRDSILPRVSLAVSALGTARDCSERSMCF